MDLPPAVQRGHSTTTLSANEYEADLMVAGRRQVADGVVELRLRDISHRPLPHWAPGSHVDLLLANDIVRQYSLCGDPTDQSHWRLGILREAESRGGSSFIHDNLVEGATVRTRGPRNHFGLVSARAYLFIAGGIGITPIIPMIAEADRAGADWRLVYGGRRRSTMAFLDELEAFGERVSVKPEEEYGLLDLDALLAQPAQDTLVYCCGPEPLLNAVETRCADWPAGALRVERFSAKPLAAPVVSGSFEIHLAQSDLTLTVPEDKTILEVVEAAGLDALSSCEEGVCGTCETAVLEGVPDHRDSVLSDDEKARNDCMMICVSRSCSPRMVLDL